MKLSVKTLVIIMMFLVTFENFWESTALLYIVRQPCSMGTVYTPIPSTVNNICLQCVCVMANIGYCKPLIVQLSIICSAAITSGALLSTTLRANVTTAPVTIPPATVPPVVATTTSIGISPRASSSAPSSGSAPVPAGSTMAVVVMVPGGATGMIGVPAMMMATGGGAVPSVMGASMAPAPMPATAQT